jgi:ubiquinone/menaquinone biosynthesis C-methylase UbiE
MDAEASIVTPLVYAASPRRALDLGMGTGRNLELLRAAGAAFVAGVDRSAAMLSQSAGGWPRVCGDARQLPFKSASFDLVCSSLMCGDVEELSAWMREAMRVLVPHGHLIYSDFHPSWAKNQWRRTFSAQDGRTYELPFYPHPIEEHWDRLGGLGFDVRSIHEPSLPGGETPVLVVIHAIMLSQGGC